MDGVTVFTAAKESPEKHVHDCQGQSKNLDAQREGRYGRGFEHNGDNGGSQAQGHRHKAHQGDQQQIGRQSHHGRLVEMVQDHRRGAGNGQRGNQNETRRFFPDSAAQGGFGNLGKIESFEADHDGQHGGKGKLERDGKQGRRGKDQDRQGRHGIAC